MDRGEMTRGEYEQSVGALRENMRKALDAKKKYELREESEASFAEEGQDERQPETPGR